jgi:hypothetical protein
MWNQRNPDRPMNRWHGFAPSRVRAIIPPARQILTWTVLFFFGLQFTRFFLVTPLDRHFCPDPSENAAIPMSMAHGDAAMEQSSSPGREEGPTFQHCKESAYGTGQTGVQPLVVPAPFSVTWTPRVVSLSATTIAGLPQNEPALPFHPPRDSR